jgi:hypothetical protein
MGQGLNSLIAFSPKMFLVKLKFSFGRFELLTKV